VTRVRAATRDDAARLVPLLEQLGYPANVAAVAARLERLVADPSSALLLAEAGGDLVGLIGAHAMPSITRDPRTCRVIALVVAHSARRRGVGRALLDEVESLARAWDCDRLDLTSSDDRAAAHAFYLANGFEDRSRRFIKRLT
jgi:GNAT superfamily N-acetyltransferase